jgi:hypothetical protein
MTTETTKICSKCGKEKPLSEMYSIKRRTKKAGLKVYYCRLCKSCRKKDQCDWDSAHRDQLREYHRDRYKDLSDERRNLIDQDKFIYWDSRKNDKKHGRDNNLTREYIRDLIKKGCLYCGDVNSRMTLDRIDNDIGHIIGNVVPACLRCNYLRRDMPYDAWMNMVPAIRDTFEKGLFGTWKCRSKKV